MNRVDELNLIKKYVHDIKHSEPIVKMFDEYGVDVSEIELIPICFADLPVSARTDHAVIYLNNTLKNTPDDIKHYLVHEITHFLQQSTGTKPTNGSESGDYLDNKEEIESFQNQTEYLADTRGDQAAKQYIERVLDHHDVEDKKERNKRKKQLLQLASVK